MEFTDLSSVCFLLSLLLINKRLFICSMFFVFLVSLCFLNYLTFISFLIFSFVQVHNNYAIFLVVIKRDFVCAEKHFLKAICAQANIQFHFSVFLNNYISMILNVQLLLFILIVVFNLLGKCFIQITARFFFSFLFYYLFINVHLAFLLLSSNDTYQYFGIDAESDKTILAAI